MTTKQRQAMAHYRGTLLRRLERLLTLRNKCRHLKGERPVEQLLVRCIEATRRELRDAQ